MPGKTARINATGAKRLMSKTSCQPFNEFVQSGPIGPWMAALLTRISGSDQSPMNRPSATLGSRRSAAHVFTFCSGRATAANSTAVCDNSAALRAISKISAPAFSNALAAVHPKPRLPPVITAFRPARSVCNFSSFRQGISCAQEGN